MFKTVSQQKYSKKKYQIGHYGPIVTQVGGGGWRDKFETETEVGKKHKIYESFDVECKT